MDLLISKNINSRLTKKNKKFDITPKIVLFAFDFYRHYYKNSPVRPACNDECRKRLLCDLRSGRSHDRKALCQSLEARIDIETRTGWRAWIYKGLALSYVKDLWIQLYNGNIETNEVN